MPGAITSAAIVTHAKRVVLWDVASGQPIGEPLSLGEIRMSVVNNVAFSPDGEKLAAVASDGYVSLWKVTNGEPLGDLLDIAVNFCIDCSLQFSHDGAQVAAVRGSEVILWDVASGQRLGEPLRGNAGGVTSVAFNPAGGMLAVGTVQGDLVLWDLANGRPLAEPRIVAGFGVTSVAFSPDGATLAVGGRDGEVVRRGPRQRPAARRAYSRTRVPAGGE